MEKDRPNPFHDDQWYPLKLGRTCYDDASTRFYSLRYEFKPASIDNGRRGTLQSSAEGKATVEFCNNQAGKPKLTFEGNMGDYQALDAMLFYDGNSFRVERMHRSVRNLRHIRVPGESSAAAATVAPKETEHESPTDGSGIVEKITSLQSGDNNKSAKKPAGPVGRSEKIEADVAAPATKPDLPSGAAKKKGNKKAPSGSRAAASKKASSPVVASAAAPPSPAGRKRGREPSPVNIDTEEVAEESPSKKASAVEEDQIEDEEVVEVSEEVVSDYEEVDISEDEDVDKTGLDQTAATLRAQAAAGLLETKASSSSSSSASGSSESGSGSSSSDSGTDEEGSASSADDGEDI